MKRIVQISVTVLVLVLFGYIFNSLRPISFYPHRGEMACPNNYTTASWNNSQYFAIGKIDPKYLDELKSKFIESGISEEYFNKNIHLVLAEQRGSGTANIYYKLDTHSWLDDYSVGGGPVIPNSDGKCQQTGMNVYGWVNTSFGEGNSGITAYSIGDKIWHNNKVAVNNHGFTEIKNILSPWRAGLLAKTCAPFSKNKYSVYITPKLTYEYVIQGKDFSTLFDNNHYMDARVDLATGEVKCKKQSSQPLMVNQL